MRRDRHGVARQALCVTVFFVNPSAAATLTVNNTSDSGAGSLRDLVSSAIAGDTINFAPSVTSIVLSNGPIAINKNLTLLGPGPALLAVRGFSSNIFNVSIGNVVISEMTLTNASGDGSDVGAFELGVPTLKLQRSSENTVLLSWPAYYGDFSVESLTNLNLNTWTTVPGAVVAGSQLNVTSDTTGGQKYFRLRAQ